MSRGKRFDESESKLNIKKVFAVIIAIIVIIMFIFIIKNLLTKDKNSGKITSSTYFTVFKDNKWGVIDSNGDTVIDPSYKEMIVVPNNKSAVFICTYDVNYETGEYKTKVLNQKNEEIFTEYDKVEAIQNKECDSGILVCRSGYGMTVVANKFKGIRAAAVMNEESAKFAKADDDINVITLGGDYLTTNEAICIIRNWLATEFKGGRYEERLKMVEEIEKNNMK